MIVKKACPFCGRYDGHDWDWRHQATISAGLAFFGVVIVVLALMTRAERISYIGLAGWIIVTAGLALWFYFRRGE